MKKFFGLIIIVIFSLVACNLEDLTKKKEDPKEQASCTVNEYGQCTTTVEGQIFYSVEDISRGDVYPLEKFNLWLVGEGHAYQTNPDENGNFSKEVEPGDYTLVTYLYDDDDTNENVLSVLPTVYSNLNDLQIPDFSNYISCGSNNNTKKGILFCTIGNRYDSLNDFNYRLGVIKDIKIAKGKNITSVDLINPKRIYTSAATGEVITTTLNEDSLDITLKNKVENHFLKVVQEVKDYYEK